MKVVVDYDKLKEILAMLDEEYNCDICPFHEDGTCNGDCSKLALGYLTND